MFYGDEKIHSSTGVQQGDPIASLIFCMAIQHVVLLIQEEVPDLDFNVWYMDDCIQAGTLNQL